jgi:hypothetical protein
VSAKCASWKPEADKYRDLGVGVTESVLQLRRGMVGDDRYRTLDINATQKTEL